MKVRQNGAAVQMADKKMTTLIPVKIKWHGGRKKVIPAATLPDQQPAHDASMLVALLRLTQLSPALVRDILNSRQPKTLSIRWLKTNELLWDWDDQQEFFGGFDG